MDPAATSNAGPEEESEIYNNSLDNSDPSNAEGGSLNVAEKPILSSDASPDAMQASNETPSSITKEIPDVLAPPRMRKIPVKPPLKGMSPRRRTALTRVERDDPARDERDSVLRRRRQRRAPAMTGPLNRIRGLNSSEVVPVEIPGPNVLASANASAMSSTTSRNRRLLLSREPRDSSIGNSEDESERLL